MSEQGNTLHISAYASQLRLHVVSDNRLLQPQYCDVYSTLQCILYSILNPSNRYWHLAIIGFGTVQAVST